MQKAPILLPETMVVLPSILSWFPGYQVEFDLLAPEVAKFISDSTILREPIAVVAQKDQHQMYRVGCALHASSLDTSRHSVMISGLCRLQLVQSVDVGSWPLRVRAVPVCDPCTDEIETDGIMALLRSIAQVLIEVKSDYPNSYLPAIELIDTVAAMADFLAAVLVHDGVIRQRLLETYEIGARANQLLCVLLAEDAQQDGLRRARHEAEQLAPELEWLDRELAGAGLYQHPAHPDLPIAKLVRRR